VEFHDVLANDEHAVALYVVRGEREGRTLEDRSVLASHVRIGSSWRRGSTPRIGTRQRVPLMVV
jgi:hypothetical protein